jgi:hypothetical protein
MNKLEEIKERHSKAEIDEYGSPSGEFYGEMGTHEFVDESHKDVAYLLSIIEQQNEILKSLAYTVLTDFTTMSEYHIKSTIVELAKKSKILCEMDIKTIATDEAINEYWDLEG